MDILFQALLLRRPEIVPELPKCSRTVGEKLTNTLDKNDKFCPLCKRDICEVHILLSIPTVEWHSF